MSGGEKRFLRGVAVAMALAACAWGVEIWREARAGNGDGPPLGAICMAVPAVGLLIGAGAVWTATNERRRR
ncbi:MAG TPA: hypothetical protein VHQ47_03305 [Phycisphaerae bacterium]|nr:hypothetical protein [Phycisphaerae bacterium]